jgi:transcriptional regulator with XRE-family HTH domain
MQITGVEPFGTVERIREWKDQSGMTWEQFAEAVGVSYKGVRRWLDKNNPTLIRKKNLERIAEVMDCDIEYLECKQNAPRRSNGHRIKLSELSMIERYLPRIQALLETTTARFTYKLDPEELAHGEEIEDSFIDGDTKYHYTDYVFDKEVSEIFYQVSINGAEPVRVSEQRLETIVRSIMKRISKEIKFLEEDKEMYPNVTKEMNRANMTAEELAQAVDMVPGDLIEALRGEKDFTFFQASKIKKALGSELLIEELFETKGE